MEQAGFDRLPITRFGREVCADLHASEHREWLVTNGIGGYASSSLAGLNTRGYHGLLVAALKPPVQRTLMLAGLVETIDHAGQDIPISTIRWADGARAPDGQLWLESVTFEGSVPTWRFAGPDLVLDRTVFMDHGRNVTRIEYRCVWASAPISLRIEPLIDFRDYHSRSFYDAPPQTPVVGEGTLTIPGPHGPESTLRFRLDDADIAATTDVWNGFDLARERDRGLTDHEDHIRAGQLERRVSPGETVQLVVAAGEEDPRTDLSASRALQARSAALLACARSVNKQTLPDWIARLVLAADQFVVARTRSDGSAAHSIIAGYPWFADWGRDTMISLPGLSLSTGRPDIAASILRAFADAMDGGMIPNRFPDDGAAPEYNTADAPFWFIEAVAAYHAHTGSDAFAAEMFPAMRSIVRSLQAGMRYRIHVSDDGLIHAGTPGVQLTWMDAKVGDWVVTPRIGKPIEINALWLSCLDFLHQVAPRVGEDPTLYGDLLTEARIAFERFWNPATGYAFDVIDGPDGDDPVLRPNQIFAARARAGAFDLERRTRILAVCEKALLTPAGLRSLPACHPDYRPHYKGDQGSRDGAYHNGTVWAWLIGPFIEAHLDCHRNPARAAQILAPMADQLSIEGVGTINEIFDADAPHKPCGCTAQAWSVAETLRAWRLIEAARRTQSFHRPGESECTTPKKTPA